MLVVHVRVMDLKRGIDKAVESVVNELKKMAQLVGNDNKKLHTSIKGQAQNVLYSTRFF